MRTLVAGHLGRHYPAPYPPLDGALVSEAAVSHALGAWHWCSDHGRDATTSMLAARIAARMFGGLGWLGVPHQDAANDAVCRLWLLKRNSLGRRTAMLLALRLDVEQGR